ncbi:MAG: hypothetical protein A2Y73_01085 [Chloroflexi bacterium RBG_13_56_8]|nr:MAG: hypothetical protein A2Y73_01085 [Chloroflexi bacterium RBG_13_56_8]
MRRSDQDPSPFALAGGPVGCLLVHGFTGAPPEMRPPGDFLHQQGISVSAPLLPGHGTVPEDLNRVRWQDWVEVARDAFWALRRQCKVVFVGGLSMGSLVVLHLAVLQPDLAGIMLYSPALKVANRLYPLLPLFRSFLKQWPKGSPDLTDPEAVHRLWTYDTYPVRGAYELMKFQRVVWGEIHRVRVPAIVFHSTLDREIHPTAGKFTFEGLGSQDKELVTLHNSGHVITVDSERESVFARTWEFMVARAGRQL